jgi:hypothetical protein
MDTDEPIPIYDFLESDVAQEALGIAPDGPFIPETSFHEPHAYKKNERSVPIKIVYPGEENQDHEYPREGSQAFQGLGVIQVIAPQEARERSRPLVAPDFWVNGEEIPGPDSQTYRPRGSKLVRTESLTPEEIMVMIRASKRAAALLVNEAKDHS